MRVKISQAESRACTELTSLSGSHAVMHLLLPDVQPPNLVLIIYHHLLARQPAQVLGDTCGGAMF